MSITKVSVIIIALLLALFITPPANASTPLQIVKGFVSRVFDGNNIIVKTRDRKTLKVCLYGTDAPELNKINRKTRRIIKQGQPFASEAKSFLSSMVFGKDVRLDVMEIKMNRHKKLVSIVWVGEKNVNLQMIKAGMAEAYVDNLEDQQYRHQFLEAEIEAKAKRLGIWSQGITYERPSDYRKH
ncbi:MAG TPA: thermonuclease family protein [Syntrophales bacterium]|nr:thermonuclease family protein [Syntrophales bacterium]